MKRIFPATLFATAFMALAAFAQEDGLIFDPPVDGTISEPQDDGSGAEPQDDGTVSEPEDDSAGSEPQADSSISGPQSDTRIKNPVAEFSGLDKITGRIISFDVYIDETVQFGALQVTPRVCYSRPVSQTPRTSGFVEVDEITLDRKIRRIFTGWMFADSPGLNAVEHAVYDVWLKGCKEKSEVPPPQKS